MNSNAWLKPALIYVCTALSCAILLLPIFQLQRMTWNVPLFYDHDALQVGMKIKGLIETGSVFENPNLGMPVGQTTYDYSDGDMLLWGFVHLSCAVSNNYSSVLNFVYLLGYPLVSLSSLFVLRSLGIRWSVAVVASILYAFMPYHYYRGEGYIGLSEYFSVPLFVLLALQLASYDSSIVDWNEAGSEKVPRRHLARTLAIIVLIGLGNVYYALFALYFLAVAGMYASATRRCWQPLATAGVLIALSCALVAVNLGPSIQYTLSHGDNPVAVRRAAWMSEVYGLKPIQLFIPIIDHRVPLLAHISAKYQRETLSIPNPENQFSASGIIACCGILFLLVWLCISYRLPSTKLLDILAVFNIWALILCSVEGISTFIALVNPSIRSWNRVSIVVDFFAMIAVANGLQFLLAWSRKRNLAPWLGYGGLGLLLVVGLLDQTSPACIPDYDATSSEWNSDAQFVGQIESTLPTYSKIYNVPYQQFPDGDGPPFDSVRCYLHSHTLRWSYGGVTGRDADVWQHKMFNLTAIQRLDFIAGSGFTGICVDRGVIQNQNAVDSLDQFLHTTLKVTPIVSQDGNFEFYDLRPYRIANNIN